MGAKIRGGPRRGRLRDNRPSGPRPGQCAGRERPDTHRAVRCDRAGSADRAGSQGASVGTRPNTRSLARPAARDRGPCRSFGYSPGPGPAPGRLSHAMGTAPDQSGRARAGVRGRRRAGPARSESRVSAGGTLTQDANPALTPTRIHSRRAGAGRYRSARFRVTESCNQSAVRLARPVPARTRPEGGPAPEITLGGLCRAGVPQLQRPPVGAREHQPAVGTVAAPLLDGAIRPRPFWAGLEKIGHDEGNVFARHSDDKMRTGLFPKGPPAGRCGRIHEVHSVGLTTPVLSHADPRERSSL